MSNELKIVIDSPKKISEKLPANGFWLEVPEKWVALGIGYDNLKPEPIIVLGFGDTPLEAENDAKKKLQKK